MVLMKLKSNQPQTTECPSGLEKPEPVSTAHSLSRVFCSPRGSALVIAIVLMLVASMLIVVGSRLLVTMNNQTQQQTLAVAEAENAARAGLVDAINWYRRKNGLVSYYIPPYPPYNPGAFAYIDDAFSPTQNATTQDTMDDTIGIVQQYPINGATVKLANANNIWARYEVRKQPNPAATPGPTSTPDPKAVHDITGERIPSEVNGEGLVWTLYSTGYIYINNDSTKSYSTFPNKVLATSQMSTEIRKLALNVPANAAAISPNMCNIHINGNGVVNALSGGSTYYAAAAAVTSAGCPSVSGSGKISPSAASVGQTINCNWVNTDPVNIFGMHAQDIKNLADFTGDATHPLIIAGSDKLSYFNGGGTASVTFDPASPVSYYQNQYLNNIGTGVIYIDNGNFTLKPVSGTQTGAFFNGVIFCNGYVTIGEGNQVTGCVMAVNGITVGTGAGGSTEKAYLNFSLGIINRENQYVAVYREDKSASHNFVGVPIQ